VFRHELLTPHKLPRQVVDGRRYYVTPSGLHLPSVTTVLGEYYKPRKPGLDAWRKKVGEKKANEVSAKARHRGTSLHSIAEKYLNNDEGFGKGVMPDALADFQRAKEVLDENVSVVMGVEFPLFSEKYRTAGTADLLCVWGNRPTVADFKTSRKPKAEAWIEDYFIQTAVYALMAKELYGVDMDQVAVILLVEHSYPDIFVKDVSDYVDKVEEIFIRNRGKEDQHASVPKEQEPSLVPAGG